MRVTALRFVCRVLAPALALTVGLGACSAGSTAPASSSAGPTRSTAPSGIPAPAKPDPAPRYPIATTDDIVDGIDWRMPAWVRPVTNSGFYSENASYPDHVFVRSLDQTWRQLQPTPDRTVYTETGQAQAMSFDPLDQALATPGDYWMRIFASGVEWAPEWLPATCKVHPYKADYDGMQHLPIWNDCVWQHLLSLYREVFVTKGLAADPRLRFVYVPGAFTWAEYDSETINDAIASGELTRAEYEAWFAHAWKDLAAIFGPHANKLVFTGEDYTWAEGLGDSVATLAKRATEAGIGIRNGIPEEFNFHLNEAPAYGSHITASGQLVVDESLPIHDGTHIVGMENECFTDCGFTATEDELEYGVTQTNLKSLQLRANWVYVKPGPSKLDLYPEQWDFVRLSLGQSARTSADAWANLREAEDTYWADNDLPGPDPGWTKRPFVRNLERWLVQRDVTGGRAVRAEVDVRSGVFAKENGTAYEGLRTDLGGGSSGLYFDLDDRFVASTAAGSTVQVKVTFWDAGGGFVVAAGKGYAAAPVAPSGAAKWRTATVTVPAAAFDGSLEGRTDLAIKAASAKDVVVRFVRVVRVAAPTS